MSTASDELLYTDTEEELRSAVRDLLTDRAPWTSVLARTETAEPYDVELWKALASGIGCAGLLVGEDLGGAGASLREAAVVAEELGKAVAPVPFLGSAVAATTLLLNLPGTEDLLRRLADGSTTAALAVPFSTPPGAFPARTTSVADALAADILLVPHGDAIHAVEAAEARVEPVVSLDMTRVLADIEFDPSSAPTLRLASGDTARAALDKALTAAAAVLASEQLGLAEQCLAMTVAYVKTRHQFGRPVGSYQGLKHRLAQLWVQITQARAVARHTASHAADDGPEAAISVALAQAHCSTVAVLAAEECVQMHGGIGFTWEHPAHLYLKRAKSSALAFGGPAHHRGALAELVNLPPG